MIAVLVRITATLFVGLILLARLGDNFAHAVEKVPFIYCTDLFQPHDDPDDHFDLATLFAIQHLDILGVVLDDGKKQRERPGRIPLAQMMLLTGRTVSYATGLSSPLKSSRDDGSGQPAEFQKGVQLILDGLRNARGKVTVFTAGNVRDIAAAFNREPQLFKEKVARLYINIGRTSGEKLEYNVTLDERAYACILQSDLPIYWCPCFGKTHGTFWRFQQEAVLTAASAPLQNFLIFALTTGRGWKGPRPADLDDPVQFLSRPVEPKQREAVGQLTRAMWCTASFFHAAGYHIVQPEPNRWIALPPSENTDSAPKIYDFVKARLTTYRKGYTTVQEIPASEQSNLHVFKVLDPDRYETVMTSCLREHLRVNDVVAAHTSDQ